MATAVAAVRQERKLRMEYAGGLVKHLGLSMYRGPVPALAELIANSWDADARRVRLSVPLDETLTDQEIRVADDGRGMTFEECQQHYLVVGRDRRADQGERTDGNRVVMGHKGLGKLAGFGIARIVEVRTVRDGELTHFRMDFDDMTKGGKANLVERYEPELLENGPTEEPNGTTVILKNLLIARSIPAAQFRESMARRFAVLSAQFQLFINGDPLKPSEVETQFRFEGPDMGSDKQKGWENVAGVGPIRWWMGFTKEPIHVADARGIRVMVRGRMAQIPFFFDLSGGMYGQHGLQYMTGVVEADELDAVVDYIGTDRQAIVWDDPLPSALRKWGQDKVQELLRLWSSKRTEANEEELMEKANALNATVRQRLERLQPTEQAEARKVIRTLASIESVTDDANRASELINMVLRAFEDSSFFALLKALDATNQHERDAVLQLVKELDVLETVKTAEVVRARVGIIRKFQQMIAANVPEKPDMQDFLFKHPWLIDIEWQVVEHEKRLEKVLVEHFKLDADAAEESDRRVDFFCIGTRGRYLVVEVKRPGQPIGKREVEQILDYVRYLRQQAPTTGQERAPAYYEGVLVGHHLTEEGLGWAQLAAPNGVSVRPWNELFDVAERIHRVYLEVVTAKAGDDVRVSGLGNLDAGGGARPAEPLTPA
jgi:RecB family endonuclease NucS